LISRHFTDPDAVIAIDAVGDRARIRLWTREDLLRHRLYDRIDRVKPAAFNTNGKVLP